MKKENLLHLGNLLSQFNIEYGEEITGQSGYIDADRINCEEVIDKIAELTKEKDEENEEENFCRKCGKTIPEGYDMCQACKKERE